MKPVDQRNGRPGGSVRRALEERQEFPPGVICDGGMKEGRVVGSALPMASRSFLFLGGGAVGTGL